MLDNSNGDKVFVGNTAALSFLRFLQRTLKHYVGPSGFTDREHSHKWFEVPDPELCSSFTEDVGNDEKAVLSRCFLDASSGFLDLYTQDELSELITLSDSGSVNPQTTTRSVDRAALASLYLIIAIGSQVRGSSSDDSVRAPKYFAQGRKIAFERMLEDPTVNLVKAFVLMAFYMFGACRRNSAFMYLGVAAKSADILGLHAAAQHKLIPKAERDSRLRVAKSIRVFDIICSSILGRRGSAPVVRSVDITLGDISTEYITPCHRDLALRANYESCSILETVVAKVVDDGPLNSSSAQHFLQLLTEWSQALPVSLRQRPRKGDPSQGKDANYREKMVANVHVAGTYYFGIILITRSFLIQHVMPQLGGGGPKSKERSRQNNDASQGTGHAVAELSRACIGAAVYMAQMCREAVDAGVFLGNMCIIKAWIFAAGLVLGFALLADESSNTDTREAFRSSQHVLSIIGRLSAQAEQYHRILAAFSDAIDNYTRQMLRHQASRVPHVEQILSYDASAGVSAGLADGLVSVQTSHDPSGNECIVDMARTQERHQGTGSGMAQLPTPEINIDDAAAGDTDFWNGSDSLSSITMSDFLPENWPSAADNELMLRILWDGYAMGFDEPLLQADASRDLNV
ncbi:hypothetical protein N0V82_001778 [Gnomoniopsis sp. IMI 355080]|nr:hypothetical protein N0V82_001778 [Gnomoniopsis sp. IMI 355080]